MVSITKLEDDCRRCASCKSEENLWNLNIYLPSGSCNHVTVLCQSCLHEIVEYYDKVFGKSPVHSMRMEFVYWIIDSIKDRLSWCNYPKMTEAMYEDLVKVCQNYTNKDYEECSDELTNALEDCLKRHGIKENDAFRMSWKWSD